MLARVKIVDWEPGRRKHSAELKLVSETMTLRDFIRKRLVAQAAALEQAESEPSKDPQYAAWRNGLAQWFVVAGEQEQALNGKRRVYVPKSKSAGPRPGIDTQMERIARAFKTKELVVLFDDIQIDELDQRVTVRDDSKVTFIRLLPLIGG
jgi:hypothetical protein